MRFNYGLELLAAVLLVLPMTVATAGDNLLRNGSFEGSLRYWISAQNRAKYWLPGEGGLRQGDAPEGQYFFEMTGGEMRSTPLALQYGKPVTVSLSARAAEVGTLTVRLGQAIGFRWCRWWWNAPMGWGATQPAGPDAWQWPDEEIDLLARHGYSVNYVMYGLPEWARVEDTRLPRDMQWKGDDPRWDDLTLSTSWDRYVSTVVGRYADRSVVWEFANEPELGKWETDEYVAMARRTARLVKKANPKAFFLTNQVEANVWAGPSPVVFEVYRLDKAGKKASRVFQIELESKKKALVEVTGVELAEGDELTFVPGYKQMHTAASFAISELKITPAAE